MMFVRIGMSFNCLTHFKAYYVPFFGFFYVFFLVTWYCYESHLIGIVAPGTEEQTAILCIERKSGNVHEACEVVYGRIRVCDESFRFSFVDVHF